MEAGNILRAKQILRSSLGNYGFSPALFRAYADVLLALNEKEQAGRYLFFSIEELEDKHLDAISAFRNSRFGKNYKSIVWASPVDCVPRLSDLPAYSRQALRDLGAPEDLSRLHSDSGERWIPAVFLAAITVVIALAGIGFWTVIQWMIR